MTADDDRKATRRSVLAGLAGAGAGAGGVALARRSVAASASRTAGGTGHADRQAAPDTANGWPMFGNNPHNTGRTLDEGPEAGVQVGWELAVSARTPPAIVDRRLFVGTASGVTAVDLDNREVDWTAETDAPVTGCPAVGDGSLFVGTEAGTAYGFTAEYGDEQWTFEADDEITTAPTYLSSDKWVYFATAGGTAYMIGAESGTERWANDEIDAATGAVTVATETTTAYVSQESGAVTGIDNELGLTNRFTFEPRGRSDPTMTPVAYDSRRAYVADDKGHLYEFNSQDGGTHWERSLEGGVRQAVASTVEHVYAATDEGHVYGFRSTTEDTAEDLWHVELDEGITGAPVIAEGRATLYLAGEAGTVFALDLTNGEERWAATLDVGEPEIALFDGSLVAVGDGIVALDSGTETDLSVGTPTPTPTPTPTATPTATPTQTDALTSPSGPTPTPTESATPTATRTQTDTPTGSDAPTATGTSSATGTAVPTTGSTAVDGKKTVANGSPLPGAATTAAVDDTADAESTSADGPLSPWLTVAGLGGLAVLARWRDDSDDATTGE